MKQELLEYLIRHCIREVLAQVNEIEPEPTKGAAAPPADGQGTADQPAAPEKKTPQMPEPPVSPQMKGIMFVNPRDKARLQKIQIQSMDDAGISRELHRIATEMGGARVKVGESALALSKEVARNKSGPLYLYLGKYDPESEEVFLMADKNLNVAKTNSVSMAEVPSGGIHNPPMPQAHTSPDTEGEYAARLPRTNETIDENLQKLIKKVINEVLDGR